MKQHSRYWDWCQKVETVLTCEKSGGLFLAGVLQWCDVIVTLFCSTPLLSVGCDFSPIGSSWNLQRGLLELGCSRPFKLWLKLQRTNNKSDTVRSSLVRLEADALKWAVRFSSGDQMEGENKTVRGAKSQLNSQPGLDPEAAKVDLTDPWTCL